MATMVAAFATKTKSVTTYAFLTKTSGVAANYNAAAAWRADNSIATRLVWRARAAWQQRARITWRARSCVRRKT